MKWMVQAVLILVLSGALGEVAAQPSSKTLSVADVTKSYRHIENQKKCRNCHVTDQGAGIKFLTGKSLQRKEIPELCGQCHGVVKRDWENSIHGKKLDTWKSSGRKLTCVDCHDPHDPKFKSMKAYPPPKRPEFGIEKGSHHGQF